MAEENDAAMAEVMKLLESEPAPAALPAANIPKLRKQLAILGRVVRTPIKLNLG